MIGSLAIGRSRFLAPRAASRRCRRRSRICARCSGVRLSMKARRCSGSCRGGADGRPPAAVARRGCRAAGGRRRCRPPWALPAAPARLRARRPAAAWGRACGAGEAWLPSPSRSRPPRCASPWRSLLSWVWPAARRAVITSMPSRSSPPTISVSEPLVSPTTTWIGRRIAVGAEHIDGLAAAAADRDLARGRDCRGRRGPAAAPARW